MLEAFVLGFWIIWSSDRDYRYLLDDFQRDNMGICRVDFRHCRPYRQQFYYFLRVGDDGRYRLFSIVATFAGLVGQIFGLTVSDGLITDKRYWVWHWQNELFLVWM